MRNRYLTLPPVPGIDPGLDFRICGGKKNRIVPPAAMKGAVFAKPITFPGYPPGGERKGQT